MRRIQVAIAVRDYGKGCKYALRRTSRYRAFIIATVLFSGLIPSSFGARATDALNVVAEQYAHLVLALGQHDPDYVDAFYGPAEWKTQAEKEKKSLEAIGTEAAELSAILAKSSESSNDELLQLRREYLQKQISSLAARVRMLKDEKLKFDDESRALYDAVALTFPDTHFDEIISQLESRIPGKGPLAERYQKWRKSFVIPKEKLDAVFQLAIKECRARTLAHVSLPPNERFTVEYVTNKPWGGYNWYKGYFHSVIMVNTDLPSYIDRAIDLAAHEGYPGHHVYNGLLEKNLVRDRGWLEFSVFALFSPQALVAEGTANYGRNVVFTKAERMKFEKEVLFPAAGIDPKRADEYYAVQDLLQELSYAVNEAARRLIDGKIDENAAAQWLEKFALMEPVRAQQRVKFIQRYRSYVINYNLGEDIIRRYIEKRSGGDAEKRWSEFAKLLSSPRLPSDVTAQPEQNRKGEEQREMKGANDFDFFIGEWRVHHRRLKERLANNQEWIEFDGTCAVRKILGGQGNMDDNVLDMPGGAYNAVTVRTYDPAKAQWSIWWIDGRYPASLDPPVVGRFENGVGTFYADDHFKGKPIRVRFLWTQHSNTPHWEQAFSTDGGKTWETNWAMDFTRQAANTQSCCPVVELRQYTLHPGQRDVLIELFEREFIETQEATGMKIIGTFRDLNNPDRFVWLRGFSDMPARAKALEEFYGGPVWKAHREAANATMIDASNVFLLRPPRSNSGFSFANVTRPPLGSKTTAKGLLVATIYHLGETKASEFADFFERGLRPIIEQTGASVLASFVTETHPNTFPKLPVRENANVFIWFSLFRDRTAWEQHTTAFANSIRGKEIAGKISNLTKGQPEVLLLAPTTRSLLAGLHKK